jgi:hypothetical protein
MNEFIKTIMDGIESPSMRLMSMDNLREMLKYYESVEAYELCQHVKDLIKIEERDIKLNELGILDDVEIPQKSGI